MTMHTIILESPDPLASMIGIFAKVRVGTIPEGIAVMTPRDLVIDLLRNGRPGVTFEVPMRIEMPCGESVEYSTEEEIPHESVPCPCGNPKHWLIKYEIGQS